MSAPARLSARDINFAPYGSLRDMLADFEDGSIDAIVFDGPLLAWYLQNDGRGEGRLVDRVFRRENYGIALPSGSPLTEEINHALLALRESGAHDQINYRYFGK